MIRGILAVQLVGVSSYPGRFRLIVITGSSGVGKSTLAKALREQLLPDQWLHFSVDSIFYCLPGSVTRKLAEQNDHSAVDSRAIITAAYACATTLLNLGHRVVFDGVILSSRGAEKLLHAFAGFDAMYVTLTCTWEEIEKRTRARGDRTLAEAEHGYKSAGGHLPAHHCFDTSTLSPNQIAARLVKAARGNV